MLIALAWAALRRRPFSVLCTIVLGIAWASLLRVPAPAALLAWVLTSLLALEVWLVLEPTILERQGCRTPTPRELERFAEWMRRSKISVRILDDPAPWVGGGFRTVVVTSGALEQLSDSGLYGLLGQAAMLQRGPILVREIVVWIGNAPLLAAWCASRWVAQLGRLLAVVIGSALLLPLFLGMRTFVDGLGRVLGAILVGLLGAMLISSGQPALGLGLWLAWAAVPGLRALLAWESRAAETDADRAAISAGLAWQLLDGLESLAHVEAAPCGALRLLVRPGAPIHKRIQRLWSAITAPEPAP